METLTKGNTQERTQTPSNGSTKICNVHGEYQAESFECLGKTRYHPCPKCAAEREAQRKKYDEQVEKKRLEKLKTTIIANSGISKRFSSCSLDNYNPGDNRQQKYAYNVANAYAQKFKERQSEGCSLIFCGKPGTGKTHLACGIANFLISQYIPVRYSTVYNAVTSVKATYRKDFEKSESEVIDSFKRPALLILDEVGVQFGSETEKMIMYHIINGRYDEVLPTIMISNLLEKELADFIGDRCVDRMREGGGVVVPFNWGSYRR